MTIKISSEVFDEYLKITLTGDNLYSEIEDIVMTIKRLAEENDRQKILIDGVNVPPLSQMERFLIGEMAAKVGGSKYKLALISKPELINKFLETVTINRGGRIIVVGSEQEALSWLLS